jgi:LysR family cyn operon transcriptional activator
MRARGHLGLLRIGATPQTIETLLAHMPGGFRTRWPAIETALVEGSNDALLDQLEAGAVHVAIAALPPQHELEGIALFSARLFAVLPGEHALAGRARLEVKALAGQPLLLLREGYMTRNLFERACVQAGVRAHSVLESSSTPTLCALAQAGHGIAVVSSSGVQARAGCEEIPLTLAGRWLRQTVSVAWNPRRPRATLVEPFVRELLDHVAHSPLAARFRERAASSLFCRVGNFRGDAPARYRPARPVAVPNAPAARRHTIC